MHFMPTGIACSNQHGFQWGQGETHFQAQPGLQWTVYGWTDHTLLLEVSCDTSSDNVALKPLPPNAL